MSEQKVEIHGRKGCPFAWRTRLVAAEKDIPFDWIPFDVESPDPRAEKDNPRHKSPLLVQGDLKLEESEVIGAYLEDAFEYKPLQSTDARIRAEMRLLIKQTEKVRPSGPPGTPISSEAREHILQGFGRIEAALGDGRDFLGGKEPNLSDLYLWPMISILEQAGMSVPQDTPRTLAWWKRAQQRPSFAETKPAP